MAGTGSTAEILFTVGVQTQQGQAAFNQFFQNLNRGLNNAEDAFSGYENAVSATSEILERAQRAGESYFQSLDRNARETIETILREAQQFQQAIQREQQERLEQVRVERQAGKQRLEAARDAQLAAIAGTANEAAERQRITQEFSDSLLALDRDVANQRIQINQAASDRITQAQQNAQQAAAIAQEATGLRGAVQDIFGGLTESAQQGTLSIDDLTGAAGKLVVALGPAGVAAIALGKAVFSIGTALVDVTNKAAEYVAQINAVTESTGVSSATAQGFIAAFSAVGGSAGDASDVIAQVGQVLNQAKAGITGATQDLQALGVQLDTIQGGNLNLVLAELASNFNNVSDAVKQSGTLARVFGEEGARQFGAVANAIGPITQRLQELGIVLDDATNKKFADLRTQNQEIEAQFQALTFALGSQFAPVLLQIKKPLADIIQSFTQLIIDNPQILTAIEDLVTILADVTVFLTRELPRGFVIANQGIQLIAQQAIAFTKVLEAIGTAVDELLNGGVTTLFQAFAQAASGDLTGAFETVQRGFRGTSAALQEARVIAQDAAKDFRDVLNNLGKDGEAATGAIAGGLDRASQAATKAASDLKTVVQENETALDRAKLGLDLFLEAGIVTRQQYAQAILEITQEQTEKELSLLQKQIESQRKLYKDGTPERLEAEQEYDRAFLEIQRRRLDAQKELFAAAAEERREQFEEQSKDIEAFAAAETRRVEEAKERRLISERDAATQIAGIERGITEQKIAALQEQLQAENVGAEERKRITQEISDLERQLAEQDAEASRTIREAEQKDAQTALDTKLAQLDQEIAKKEILIDQARQQGATSQELAALEQQLLNLQLEGLDAQIAAARDAGASEAELIQLQTQRLRLIAEIKSAQLQASGEIADAYGREGQAAEDAANKSQDAAARAKAASQSNLSAIYGFINGLVAQANSITRENVDEMMDYLESRVIEASLALANVGPQIAGIFEFYSQKANEALQKAREKEAEFQREDARKAAEDARRIQDEALNQARDAYADYTEDKKDLEEDYAKTVRDINKELASLPEERAQKETEIRDRTAQDLAELDKQIADNQIREAQRAAFEQQRVELDSQAELRRIREGNQRDALSGEADFIVERARLQAQLAEAQASGDTEAATAAQTELDALNQEQLTEEQRQAEIETALTSGKTQEEIDLELEAINAKYDAQQEYNRQRLELIQLGDIAALAALDANFQAQQDLIQQQYQNELTYLQQKNALAEQERQAELAQEQADLEERRNQILARQAQELEDLRTQYATREQDLKDQLKKEENEYDRAMTAIETRVAEAYSKMSDAAKAFFDQLKAGLDLASQAPGGSTGGNSSTSGGGGGGGGGGNSTRDTSTPPPSSTPPNTQTGGNQSGGGRGGGRGGRGSGGSGKNEGSIQIYDFDYDLTGTLSELEQSSYQLVLSFCKDTIDQYKAGNITFEKAFEVIKDSLGKGLITLQDFSEFADELNAIRKDQEKKGLGIADDITKPGDLTGELTTTGPGRESPGPPATPPPPPATEPPKPVRDAKLANDLIFAAQNATTKEKGQAVLKAAAEALKTGKIDDSDRGKIRAELDARAFQSGYGQDFNTDALGQNATRPAIKPGSPGTPGAPGIKSFQDAQSALSSTSLANPQPATLTAPGALSPVDIPPPAPPAINIQVGDISGTNQDEIIAALVDKMRDGLNDAGVP